MRKWLLLTTGITAAAVAAVVWFYQSVRSDFEQAGRRAIEAALKESSLVQVERVVHFAGDIPYGIVFGGNETGEPLIVWVGGGEVHEAKAADGVTEDEVRSLLERRNGSVELIRLTPGVLDGEYVWEAFYKKEEPEGYRHYYDYYRFSDGNWLDTYRLGAE